jgi:glyceraldehyde 3-phosphate dehydrogenase
VRVLLNGVGRIGKAIVRIALKSEAISIVAINELNTNVKNIAYSLNYDTTYGRLEDAFVADENSIENSVAKIKLFNVSSLDEIDFKAESIDYVIDASGSSVHIDLLKKLHVKAVFLTHPNAQADVNVVLGVNGHELASKTHKVISTSSCNATALLPVMKLIDDHYEIECGEITTIHPLLNHQKLLDSGCIGAQDREIACNFEFGRSATQNIIPSKTTTIKACSFILPHINADRISSSSFRIPTQTVGVIDITLLVKKSCTKEELLECFKAYEEHQKFTVLLNNSEPLVSSDFIAQTYTTIIDHRFSDVKMNKMIKLAIWYDNEWGYASKVVDIVEEYHRHHSE